MFFHVFLVVVAATEKRLVNTLNVAATQMYLYL